MSTSRKRKQKSEAKSPEKKRRKITDSVNASGKSSSTKTTVTVDLLQNNSSVEAKEIYRALTREQVIAFFQAVIDKTKAKSRQIFENNIPIIAEEKLAHIINLAELKPFDFQRLQEMCLTFNLIAYKFTSIVTNKKRYELIDKNKRIPLLAYGNQIKKENRVEQEEEFEIDVSQIKITPELAKEFFKEIKNEMSRPAYQAYQVTYAKPFEAALTAVAIAKFDFGLNIKESQKLFASINFELREIPCEYHSGIIYRYELYDENKELVDSYGRVIKLSKIKTIQDSHFNKEDYPIAREKVVEIFSASGEKARSSELSYTVFPFELSLQIVTQEELGKAFTLAAFYKLCEFHELKLKIYSITNNGSRRYEIFQDKENLDSFGLRDFIRTPLTKEEILAEDTLRKREKKSKRTKNKKSAAKNDQTMDAEIKVILEETKVLDEEIKKAEAEINKNFEAEKTNGIYSDDAYNKSSFYVANNFLTNNSFVPLTSAEDNFKLNEQTSFADELLDQPSISSNAARFQFNVQVASKNVEQASPQVNEDEFLEEIFSFNKL